MAYIKKYDDDTLLKYKNPTPRQQAFLEAGASYRKEAVKNYNRRKGLSLHFGPIRTIMPGTHLDGWKD